MREPLNEKQRRLLDQMNDDLDRIAKEQGEGHAFFLRMQMGLVQIEAASQAQKGR